MKETEPDTYHQFTDEDLERMIYSTSADVGHRLVAASTESFQTSANTAAPRSWATIRLKTSIPRITRYQIRRNQPHFCQEGSLVALNGCYLTGIGSRGRESAPS
jgi:hypothetical protein